MSPDLANEVHTHIEPDRFWIMAHPDADVSAAFDEAQQAGFTVVDDSWYDTTHDWDIQILTRS
jgi:hypothetical protein